VRASCRIVVAVLLLSAAGAATAGQSPEPLYQELLTGDQKLLQPGYLIGNIAMADPRVCNFRVLPERKTVLLVAVSEGHTTLTIFDQQGVKRDDVAIDVISREFAKLRDDVQALVTAYPDVEVASLGRRLTLTGTVATAEQLKELQRLAAAAGNVTSLVTLRESGSATPPGPPPSASTRSSPTPAPPPVAALPATPARPAPRPAPPAPVPPGTATPVPLGSSPASGGTASPVAFPTITSAGAVARSMDYSVELMQSPASAPPPDVLGPVGTVIFKTRLSVPVGTLVRQFVAAGAGQPSGREAAGVVGISIGVHPALEPDGRLRTSLVVDTNLPVGRVNAGEAPVWRRGVMEFVHGRAQSLYVTERDLDAAFGRDSAAATELLGRSPAGGSSAEARAGNEALGAMFRGGPDSRDAAKRGRESVLVIVITPIDGPKEPRP
jgi:hypothetical protein